MHEKGKSRQGKKACELHLKEELYTSMSPYFSSAFSWDRPTLDRGGLVNTAEATDS